MRPVCPSRNRGAEGQRRYSCAGGSTIKSTGWSRRGGAQGLDLAPLTARNRGNWPVAKARSSNGAGSLRNRNVALPLPRVIFWRRLIGLNDPGADLAGTETRSAGHFRIGVVTSFGPLVRPELIRRRHSGERHNRHGGPGFPAASTRLGPGRRTHQARLLLSIFGRLSDESYCSDISFGF